MNVPCSSGSQKGIKNYLRFVVREEVREMSSSLLCRNNGIISQEFVAAAY
jgi:hypothetical protein